MRTALALCAFVLGAANMDAAAIQSGIWYNVQAQPDNTVIGGVDSVPFYSAPGAGPWTFTLVGNGVLEFTDGGFSGESYRVFNFGNALNTNSNNTNFTGQGSPLPNLCGPDPLDCFNNSDFANETFTLAGGVGTNFSLSFLAVDNPNFTSDAFFRVIGTFTTPSGTTTSGGEPPVDPPTDPPSGDVPEPSTYALVGSAIALLVWKRRKA
jgi:hypothetical protein